MAGFKLNLLSGIRPRVPESLLPQGAATIAHNCDFAYGELRNTKGGFLYAAMQNAPKSIYTDDGLSFYTWENDVNAVRSPLAKDTFNRMYYTGDVGFKVANRLGMRVNGGPPSSAYLVGVPRPSQAPALKVETPAEVNTTTATLAFKVHWEYGGVKYQEQVISPVAINNTQYQFTPPTRATDTPEQAFPVLRLTATALSDSAQICDLYTDNSSFESTGGLYSMTMAKDTSGGTYTATLTVGIKEEDKETRAYVYTYVNTYGEEGPPSAPATVTTSPLVPVSVTVTKDNLSGYGPISEVRIYRTPTGSTIADYFYVGTVGVLSGPGTFIFKDDVKAEMLNEALSSTNYYPPDQALVGLMTLPNGILCAWKGNELHFSEAYKPWAWPPQYVKPLPNAIVGGIAHGSGAVITTAANPYMVSGVSPDAMTTTRLNVDQAGVSKWSIAVVDGAVLYASNDGLVAITGASASLAQSQQFFTREVWRTRYGTGLASMRFSTWDGRLVVFSGSGAFTPFMIRVDEADGTMTELPSFAATCAFISQLSDQFYYALGTGLYQFNGGLDLPAAWQSAERVLQRPANFGFAQAVATGNWVIQFYAGGELKHTQSVGEGVTDFRLPGGFLADRWKIMLTGSGRFRELRVAQTARELATL